MPRIKKTQIQAVKGMHDILPEEQPYWEHIVEKAKIILEDYGFEKIDTPIVEYASLYQRSIGEESDIIEKEMYSFRRKGGDLLALRPEHTGGLVRAYIEHGLHVKPHPIQLWSLGPVFRHDNPQAGRYRQFNQLDADMLGDPNPASDAIMIFLSHKILESIGIKDAIIKINSVGDADCRPNYIKTLKEYYRRNHKKLCANCQKRIKTNPLRLLDCKNPDCIELSSEAPQFVDYLDEECKKHFKAVLEFLDELEIPYILDHRLVRGLDYYTKTAFEIILETNGEADKKDGDEDVPTNAKNLSLGGGGRYDRLAEFLGGPKTPAIGWSLGIERVIMTMKALGIEAPEPRAKTKVFIAQLGEMAKSRSLKLFEECRKAGLKVKATFGRDSIKAQLRIANRLNIPYTIIIGQKEALEESAIIREMDTGIQETVPAGKVVEIIKQRLKRSKR